jgi:digeranylgeranylglycerophospholipid reductase
MTEKIFKTIIVGAGPAGLTAGRYLEDALILEQKEEIGRPVQCAEGLAKKALERQGIEPDPSWISTVIDGFQIIVPNGKAITFSFKEAGYILDRVAFEKFLVSKCKGEVQLKKRVKDIGKEGGLWKVITDKNEIFKSQYLIGADGPFSMVRKKIFKEDLEFFPAIEYLVGLRKEIDTSIIKMYFDKKKFPLGYAWIFPKTKNTANIGLGGKMNLQGSFEDFMEKTIRKELGPYQILENRSGVISFGGAKIELEKDGAFLVGDSGGLADPIFAGGIDNAMISGKIAAESILTGSPHLYQSKIKSTSAFNKDLLSVKDLIYSLDNEVLNEIGEILEKRKGDVLYLKSFPAFFDFLSKPPLRKNIFKFLKLFSIYYKHIRSWI